MNNTFGYIDIILLAMIAAFIILRLRNILGKKTGHEEKKFTGFNEKQFEQFVKPKNPVNIKKEDDKLHGLNKAEFLNGAEVAYETIITEFAKGNKNKLKSLLTINMSKNFEEAINVRIKNNTKSELTFIGIKSSELEKFEKIKNEFFATVKFVSEIISVKKDKENKIIEGNPDKIKTVTDYWIFSKFFHSKSPNWYLSEIISK
ncbi:MAG: putative lipid-binding transport protein, Tim44 family [Pelagibacterales bacterium]|nr:putative lipid-binding transport protein, Tim44 family [Pelagibacterales bacterium]